MKKQKSQETALIEWFDSIYYSKDQEGSFVFKNRMTYSKTSNILFSMKKLSFSLSIVAFLSTLWSLKEPFIIPIPFLLILIFLSIILFYGFFDLRKRFSSTLSENIKIDDIEKDNTSSFLRYLKSIDNLDHEVSLRKLKTIIDTYVFLNKENTFVLSNREKKNDIKNLD